MSMLLKEFEQYKHKYAGHVEGAWELHHEDLGFLGPDLMADRELIDVDGCETHLMHQMDQPVSHEKQRRVMQKRVMQKRVRQ